MQPAPPAAGTFRKHPPPAPPVVDERPTPTEERRAPVHAGRTIASKVIKPVGAAAILLMASFAWGQPAPSGTITAPQGGEAACPFAGCKFPLGTPINVRDPPPPLAAAVGNGVANDTAAIQAALTGGSRSVFFPCGTYLHETLLLDDMTELVGAGACTVLKRSNTLVSSPQFQNCTPQPAWTNKDGLRNRNQQCGTTGLTIRNLVMDGSLITTPPNPPTINSELGMNLEGATYVTIDHVVMRNWPQDAIYFRNHAGSSVTNSIFDGHNLLWGNGGAVNYESSPRSNNASLDPLIVSHNLFIDDGPAFCDGTGGSLQATPCDADATCAGGAGKCIGGGTVAIGATGIDNGSLPPALLAEGNTIRLSNYHLGIQANYARNVKIANNDIRAVPTRAGGLTGMEKRMRGIQCYSVTSGTRPIVRDCVITGNTVVGDASVTSLSFIANNRQQGGIFVQGDAATTDGIVIADNTVRDFALNSTEAAITVFATIDGTLRGNIVRNILTAAALYRVGASGGAVTNEVIEGNIGDTTDATVEMYQLQEVTASTLIHGRAANVTTRYQFLGTDALTLDDQQGVTNATLSTVAASIANGGRAYCSDCTIANPCAGSGTGALAKRLNGVWVCN